jgi:hypothetical protein
MQSIPPPPFGVGSRNEHRERPWVELLSKLIVFPASISEREGRTGTTQPNAYAAAALHTRKGLHLIELRALRFALTALFRSISDGDDERAHEARTKAGNTTRKISALSFSSNAIPRVHVYLRF